MKAVTRDRTGFPRAILYIIVAIAATTFLGCKSIEYSRILQADDASLHLTVKLRTYEDLVVTGKVSTFVRGSLGVSNRSNENAYLSLERLRLQLDQSISESCYVDSVASFVDPIMIKPMESRDIDVYWVYDGNISFRFIGNANLTIIEHEE